MDNPNTAINEFSVLWVDVVPVLTDEGAIALNNDGTKKVPHDYVVKKVARSLNSVSIAISKVNVSA